MFKMKLKVFLLSVLLTLPLCATVPTKITCDNFKDYEVITYSMPLLRGECGPEKLEVYNRTTGAKGAAIQYQGRYKALIDLHYGVNEIELKSGSSTFTIHIKFEKLESPNIVKFYYVLPKDGTTAFYTPPGYTGENTNYVDRFDRAAKIMQTFSAHDLDDHPWKYGKKTFQLELDKNYHVVVHVVTSAYTLAEIQSYRKADGKRYDNFKFHAILREACGHDYQKPDPSVQYVAVGNTTDLKDGIWVGHTATGGGGFGGFGSGALYTWPTTLQGIFDNFMDNTPMDPAKEVDDSCGRHRRWAHFATTLGATIHENGHALGLPHFYGKYVIMSRGHDQLNRVFTFCDPPTARVANTNYFEKLEIGHWSDSAAAFLNEHPFFNPNRLASGKGPKIYTGRQPSSTILEDESGIVWYAYRDADAYHFSDTVAFDKPYPKRLSITKLPPEAGSGSGALLLVASNGNGYKSEVTMDQPGELRDSYSLTFTKASGYVPGALKEGFVKGIKDKVIPIVRKESKVELSEPGPKAPKGRGMVLHVGGPGHGLKVPLCVGVPSQGAIKAFIKASCDIKPALGGTILDFKDNLGTSFFYLEYKENGDLVIFAKNEKQSSKSLTFKGVGKAEWQNVALVLDLESRKLTSLLLDGQELIKEPIYLGSAKNFVSSVWLKNTDAAKKAAFYNLEVKFENK